ncbi:MAG: methyltransferase domain-containing protein [Sphingobacteriales bacterium]|nr:MAG: methyltransferase domain-containing protein [Sphingobacteriales bacterium]
MRIVGGMFSGRRFSPPTSTPARPTTDVAKEALFNMLQNMIDIEDAKTCDLFAGTGSISYELASRGAAELTLIERDPTNINFIRKIATELGIKDKFNIIRGNVFKFMKQNVDRYDLIFADPPYALPNMDDIPQLVFERNMLLPGGLLIMEHSPRNNYQQHPAFTRTKNYGTTVFSFFTQPE